MATMRKPFQGVWNIIRFNWHFYIVALVAVVAILLLDHYTEGVFYLYKNVLLLLILGSTSITLLVSWYVYDLSGLYQLNWIENPANKVKTIVNINAGFDETSDLLKEKFKASELIVLDFYDPSLHTEVSIERARKAYPPYPGTRLVKTAELPLTDTSADRIFVLLAAHEIRNKEEQVAFFRELRRILQPAGRILVMEHLRDLPNFLAYNIGFFHFHSKKSWYRTFQNAGLHIAAEIKITPFITTFILEKNGITA